MALNEKRVKGLSGFMKGVTIALLLAFLPTALYAQRPGESDEEYLSRTKWWQDARLGLIMHWGLGCKYKDEAGCQLSWARPGSKPLNKGSGCNPNPKPCAEWVESYDGNRTDFSPTKWDPDSIVRMAKRAGLGYITLTVKHHEGFAMWQTKQLHSKNSPTSIYGPNPHSIAQGEWGKADTLNDPTLMLAKACAKENMPFGIYYSPRDWFNPDQGVGDNSVFHAHMMAQLTELLDGKYGRVATIWWDGFGRAPGTASGLPASIANDPVKYWKLEEVMDSVYALAPWIISNSRCSYTAESARTGGDFDVGEGGDPKAKNPLRLTERINTTKNNWGWTRDKVRTFASMYKQIVGNACKGGNYLLNIDPKPDGTISEGQVKFLADYADYMQKYGNTIVKTRKGPWSDFSKRGWGGSTCRDSVVFVHLYNWSGGTQTISTNRTMLSYEAISPGIKAEQNASTKTITITSPKTEELDYIVAIKIDSLCYDTLQYYDPKWDPYIQTSVIPGTKYTGFTPTTPTGAIKVSGDFLRLPSRYAGRVTTVALYTLNGRFVKEAVIRHGRASLKRDLGVRPGVYIIKIK